MRHDDVRLSGRERAAFHDLARRLGEVPPDADGGRVRRVLGRAHLGALASGILIVTGVGAILYSLLAPNVWAAPAGLVVLLVGLHRVTRRWNVGRLLLWWRRRPPEPPAHMWEP